MLVEIQPGESPRLQRIDPSVSYSLAGIRALINPGSVGQPRDGDPRASVALLDTDGHSVSWHRIAYDIDAAQRAIRAAGLPNELAARLSRGR
jgi:diadenosine tetraphosphatase ApaH/serine/threonine PP2A family protein phosphatase